MHLPASLTRDMTDTKWLALAIKGSANYLVTNDRRHLLHCEQLAQLRSSHHIDFLQCSIRNNDGAELYGAAGYPFLTNNHPDTSTAPRSAG